jgi:predicted DNA-binding transcriptional regulator YafY
VRADRLVAIVLLLQARGAMSAGQLAKELEVSTRTILRDVEALGAAGVPVYTERGAGGGIRLLDGYRTDLTGLSAGEAEALFLMGIPGPLDELGLGSSLDAARRKVLAALPPAGRDTAERVRQRIHVDATDWETERPAPRWLATITRALWDERRLVLRYVRADNKTVLRHVDPLGLVLKAGQWYLVAWAGRWDATFRVSRVVHAEIVDEAAHRPPDFDLAAYWEAFLRNFDERRAPLSVRIRVEPHAVDLLPRALGEGVRTQLWNTPVADDGSVELDLRFDSLDDARLQLMGLGTSITVLDPPALCEDLVRSATELVRAYSPDAGRLRR